MKPMMPLIQNYQLTNFDLLKDLMVWILELWRQAPNNQLQPLQPTKPYKEFQMIVHRKLYMIITRSQRNNNQAELMWCKGVRETKKIINHLMGSNSIYLFHFYITYRNFYHSFRIILLFNSYHLYLSFTFQYFTSERKYKATI